MGNLFFYKNDGYDLGNCSKARWQHARRLLPLLIDFINSSMNIDWADGVFRSVNVSDEGKVSPSTISSLLPRPTNEAFVLDSVLVDNADDEDTIYITDADELLRLFSWCSFMEQRDGVYTLYKPLIDALQSWTHGIENCISAN